ncbi:uncharacterized protein LOC130750976 [Actinidia eriantha]|uniref:uncharacterized protein LOC130750976 n=1 Tax=Actinidia eriantha TaxID=165200 RepID=UPI002585C70E|nr:uncharacterized protein LOC130750976 [Actinidia eriantha]
MATSGHRLLFRISLLLGLLAIAADARPGRQFHPCQTLIFFSSFPVNQNPSYSLRNPSSLSERRSITFFFTGSRDLEPEPVIFLDRAKVDEEKRPQPFSFDSFVGSSFRDRTKDILTVVASLLLGVGCGALTAATLYLIWSLFAPNRFEIRDYDDESDDDLKKVAYVAIPAADAPAKDVV